MPDTPEMLETLQRRRLEKPDNPDDARTRFDIDYARIVHSSSFRRLQGKTQILNLGDSDFYRTRLTHTLEVAQIAGSILNQIKKGKIASLIDKELLPSHSLIQAICLTHDLGHPPFGHGGEVALNYCMRDAGGFEGNGQSLRILTKLEKFTPEHGANLTRRSLLGILKYPASYSSVASSVKPTLNDASAINQTINRKSAKPPKCYLDSEADVMTWLLETFHPDDVAAFQKSEAGDKPESHRKPLHKSFDCSIMDIADDIAYGVHDLEDAVALKLVSEKDFEDLVPAALAENFLSDLSARGQGVDYATFAKGLFADSVSRKHYIGRLVHYFITNIEMHEMPGFIHPLLKYRLRINAAASPLLKALKQFVAQKVILSPKVQQLEFKGQRMVIAVFEVFASEPRAFLPPDVSALYDAYEKKDKTGARVICDYIAGMTDSYLMKTYDRLFSPHMGSVFDKL